MPGDAVSLIAPDLLLAEFASLIAKRVRRRLMQSNEASKAFQLMKVSAPVLFSTIALLEGAFELAIATQMSVWDSVYLALAIEINCPMITADRRLFRGRSARHPAIRLLGSRDHKL
jgi:predicted nucleic acid-binding protein